MELFCPCWALRVSDGQRVEQLNTRGPDIVEVPLQPSTGQGPLKSVKKKVSLVTAGSLSIQFVAYVRPAPLPSLQDMTLRESHSEYPSQGSTVL